MTYGIELNNNGGKLVIGGNQKNLIFHEKLTATAGTYGLEGVTESDVITTLQTTITDSSKRPVVYFIPEQDTVNADNGYMPVNLYYDAGKWKVDVASGGQYSNAVTLYIFVERDIASSGWGIQTFNSDGTLAFDSGDKPLVSVGVVSVFRSSDSYTFDPSFATWSLGSDIVSIPAAAQVPRQAISCGPFFYGSAFASVLGEQEGVSNDHILGGIKRHSQTQFSTFEAYMGGYASPTGYANSAPLWPNKDIFIINGAIYD